MKKALLVIALLAALPAAAYPADPMFEEDIEQEEEASLKTSVFLYPFVEEYRWMEFFDGGQILEEKGELYGAGAIVSFESGRALYRIRGEWFQGTVDGEGVTSLGTGWTTDVTYYGFRLEGDGGWRFPVARDVSIAPILGVGYRWWRRDFENSPTVAGGLEKWHTFYFKLGLLGEYNPRGTVAPYVEGGLRLGVFNNNEIDYNGGRVSLDPGGRLTPYAEVGIRAGFLKAAAYYERMEFAESTPEVAIGLPPGWGLVQPEVKANIYGARVGVVF